MFQQRDFKTQQWANVVGRIMAPKDVYILLSRTPEFVVFHSKRDFTDVIKDAEVERLSWIIWVGQTIIWVLIRGRQKGDNQSINPDRSISSTTTNNSSSWVLTNNQTPE